MATVKPDVAALTALTLQWSEFVDEYLKDYSMERAYCRAYGVRINTKIKTLARHVMEQPWVHAEIVRRSKDRLRPTDISGERVLLEMARIAFSDIRKTVKRDAEGNQRTLMIGELDEDTARAVTGHSTNARGEYDVKLSDKMAALKTLAQITGVIPEKTARVTHTHQVGSSADYESCDESEIAAMLESCDVIDMETDE